MPITYFSLFVAGSQQEIIIPADIPLVQELGATLREWAQIWHKFFIVCFPITALVFLFLHQFNTLYLCRMCCHECVHLTDKQNHPVQESAADGLQPHRVSISDSVGNAAEG